MKEKSLNMVEKNPEYTTSEEKNEKRANFQPDNLKSK